MSNHTEGDWEMIIAPEFGPEEYEGVTIESPSTGTIICEIAGGLPLIEILGNAKLIAKAPKLLDCLKEALEVMGNWDEEGDPGWAKLSREIIQEIEKVESL
jgi:hypothetical protein